jgi:hypothetical protein
VSQILDSIYSLAWVFFHISTLLLIVINLNYVIYWSPSAIFLLVRNGLLT